MIFATWENVDDHASDLACHLLSGGEDQLSGGPDSSDLRKRWSCQVLFDLSFGVPVGDCRELLPPLSCDCRSLSGTANDLALNHLSPPPRGYGVARGDRGGVGTNNNPLETKGARS